MKDVTGSPRDGCSGPAVGVGHIQSPAEDLSG